MDGTEGGPGVEQGVEGKGEGGTVWRMVDQRGKARIGQLVDGQSQGRGNEGGWQGQEG